MSFILEPKIQSYGHDSIYDRGYGHFFVLKALQIWTLFVLHLCAYKSELVIPVATDSYYGRGGKPYIKN